MDRKKTTQPPPEECRPNCFWAWAYRRARALNKKQLAEIIRLRQLLVEKDTAQEEDPPPEPRRRGRGRQASEPREPEEAEPAPRPDDEDVRDLVDLFRHSGGPK